LARSIGQLVLMQDEIMRMKRVTIQMKFLV